MNTNAFTNPRKATTPSTAAKSTVEKLRSTVEQALQVVADDPVALRALLEQAKRQATELETEIATSNSTATAKLIRDALTRVLLDHQAREAGLGGMFRDEAMRPVAPMPKTQPDLQNLYNDIANRGVRSFGAAGPAPESPLEKAMDAASGPTGDGLVEARRVVGGDSQSLIDAINELARQRLEQMFRGHRPRILGI